MTGPSEVELAGEWGAGSPAEAETEAETEAEAEGAGPSGSAGTGGTSGIVDVLSSRTAPLRRPEADVLLARDACVPREHP